MSYTPAPLYEVYSASLQDVGYPTQPNVVVFENTIGNIVWSSVATGAIWGTLTGGFSLTNTMVLIGTPIINPGFGAFRARAISTSVLEILSLKAIITGPDILADLTDGLLDLTFIEIRNYL